MLTASRMKTTVDIPAGALPADTTAMLTPVTPAAGESARLGVSPSGRHFAHPVTMSFELPAGQRHTGRADDPAYRQLMRPSLGAGDANLASVKMDFTPPPALFYGTWTGTCDGFAACPSSGGPQPGSASHSQFILNPTAPPS